LKSNKDKGCLDNNREWTSRLRAVWQGNWRLKDSQECELETWEAKAVIKDAADKEGKSEEEIKKRCRLLVGKRKRDWKAEVRKYKKWKHDPYNMVVELLYAAKRTQDGGRNLIRKVEKMGAETVVENFKLNYPSLEIYIEEGLARVCGPVQDPTPWELSCHASNWPRGWLRSKEN